MLQENDIQKSVLEKVRTRSVSMRSKLYFALRIVLVGVLSIITLACSIFALSFIYFSVHESGEQFLLGFDQQGLVTFALLFPWLILLLAILLLVTLETLLRNFKFGYRLPLLRIFLWLFGIGAVGSMLVSITPLHSFLLLQADKDQLPILGPLYESIHDSHREQGVYRGNITSITESDFVISYDDTDRDSDEGSWTIVPPKGFGLGTLSLGEKVYVAGRIRQGIVYAYGIRPVLAGVK